MDGLAERAVWCGCRESTCDGWGLVMIEDTGNVVHIHNEMQASLCMHMQCRISVRQDSAYMQACWELSTKFQANLPCSTAYTYTVITCTDMECLYT